MREMGKVEGERGLQGSRLCNSRRAQLSYNPITPSLPTPLPVVLPLHIPQPGFWAHEAIHLGFEELAVGH